LFSLDGTFFRDYTVLLIYATYIFDGWAAHIGTIILSIQSLPLRM